MAISVPLPEVAATMVAATPTRRAGAYFLLTMQDFICIARTSFTCSLAAADIEA
jgi:hypothetical protein